MTDTSLSLSWDAVNYSEGIAKYEVYRDSVSIGTRVGTSFSDSSLTASTAYKYQVKAIGVNGVESSLSEPLNVTTTAGAGA